MATPAYLSITGTKQGLITAGVFTADSVGNTYQEGHGDQVMVQGFSHEVIIPRDPQSGQPTGQRIHKPVKITKVFDKSSPLLPAALTSGAPESALHIATIHDTRREPREHTQPFICGISPMPATDILASIPKADTAPITRQAATSATPQ